MADERDSGGTLEEFRARARALWGEKRAAEIDEETLRKTAAAVDRMHALSPEIASGPGFYLGEFSRSARPEGPEGPEQPDLEQEELKQDEEARDD